MLPLKIRNCSLSGKWVFSETSGINVGLWRSQTSETSQNIGRSYVRKANLHYGVFNILLHFIVNLPQCFK